jgi:hypothetical protein
MPKWAYVICEWVEQPGGDRYPSFRHGFVEANDEDGAYAEGHRTVAQPTGNGINDYAFPLPEDVK